MSETPFKRGDRVLVVDRRSYNVGRRGVVTEVRDDPVWPGIVVEFAPGDTCLYPPGALRLVAGAER